MLQNLQNFAKFQKFQLDNLVDFEKCCKTHIYLQRSAPIQPKTSEILPKFVEIGNYPTLPPARPAPARRGAAGVTARRPPPRSATSSRRRRRRRNYDAKLQIANFWRARSRLYQNEILQENMRLTAFFNLYKICILLHRCSFKNLAKNGFEF